MNWACTSCRGENPEGMRFCGHCGAPAAAAPVSAAPPEPPPVTPGRLGDAGADSLRSFVTGQVADRLIESGGELTEERRLVTALFADLSGFTPLSERLDAEELLEVIDPIIRSLSDIVGRYEGFVEKFAGDALLALFGAPVAHEDDAARAVLVAIEMHRELANLRVQLGDQARDLTLHIGINSGHGVARLIGSAVRTDYAVLGDSVILAQRLESAAPPGETYIGETTFRLVRDRFELEPVGPLTLKGKSEPVPAWRVLSERAAAERSATGEHHVTPLIGRTEEVNAVRAVLEGLATGTGGLVSVIGEPGLGKSRLTDEARSIASMLGIRWIEARSLSYGAGLAYWPYLDLVRRVAGFGVDDPPDVCTERLRAALAADRTDAALPFLGHLLGLPDTDPDGTVSRLEPEAFRRGLHEAFAAWLKAMAEREPLVLAMEDCHWIDAASAALTLDLARACHEERLLIYLTGRPVEGGLVDEVARAELPIALALRLQPLEAHGVSELAEYLLGGTPPSGLLAALYERSGGNPFFVQETVRSLLDSGVLLRTDGRWDLRAGWEASAVPETIEGVLAARIDALPASASRLLGVASVIGRRVRMPLLRSVASGSVDTEPAVAHLVHAGFLDRAADSAEETVVFHHALMQDVAYGRLLRRRRRDLHRRTAEEAERLWGAGDDVVDLLARHLYLAEAGSRAVEYLVRAGHRARRLFANAEAILHFSRAVELVRADATLADRLSELLLTTAELEELTGDYDRALKTFSEVRDLTGEVRAWRGTAAIMRRLGRYDEALASLDGAFEAMVNPDADLRALWLERGWTLSVRGDVGDAIVALRTGLSLGEEEDAITGGLLVQLARAETLQGASERALAHASQARAIFERIGDQRGLASALRVVGDVADDLGRLDEAADALRRGLEVAQRVGSAEEIGGCLINLGMVEQRRGNLDTAIECDQQAIEEFERIGHAAGRATAYGNLADKLAEAGNYTEALVFSERALAIAEAIGHRFMKANVVDTIAIIRAAEGDLRQAAEKREEAADLYVAAGATRRASEELLVAAEDWQRAGDDERAASLTARSKAMAEGVLS